MTKTAKVVVTIVIVFVFSVLFGMIAESRGQGRGPGFIGLILLAGLIGALRAIWKKPKQNDASDNNNSILQK